MARVRKNLLLNGLSGKVGSLVFRQVASETIVSARPAKRSKAARRSAREQARAARFTAAMAYGRQVLRDPAARALYARGITVGRKVSAYHVALSDYLRAPEIKALDLTAYRGREGDLLRVRATDNFEVCAVRLRLLTAGGEVLERGAAQVQGGDWWHYVAQTRQAGDAELVWVVEAHDRAGNVTTMTATWEPAIPAIVQQ